jgi:2-polyprenyl-3-methyl-5-hydroxy-6-metoxy-1,4-benzoquinol methylase
VNPPKPEEMPFHYDRDYHNAIAKAGEGSPAKRWQCERETVVKYKQRGAILDIGCSSGGFLSTMMSDSWKLCGIEMEPSMAERARRTTGAEVFIGDAIEAPFAPESFDVVTTFDVLEHMYDPNTFLAKVRQWLKPGGIYCTRVPNIDCWESRMLGSFWYGLELPRHLFHFSPRALRSVMAALGFEEVQVQTSPVSYLERGAGYLYSAGAERLGFSVSPQSENRSRGVALRAARKAIRLTVVEPFCRLASIFGEGASMLAIFRKPI